MKTYLVYQLVDPRNNIPFYVGCTIRGLSIRLAQHITRDEGTRGKFIDELMSYGLKPEIELLDKLTTNDSRLAGTLEFIWWNYVNTEYVLANDRKPSGYDYFLTRFDLDRQFIHILARYSNDINLRIKARNQRLSIISIKKACKLIHTPYSRAAA